MDPTITPGPAQSTGAPPIIFDAATGSVEGGGPTPITEAIVRRLVGVPVAAALFFGIWQVMRWRFNEQLGPNELLPGVGSILRGVQRIESRAAGDSLAGAVSETVGLVTAVFIISLVLGGGLGVLVGSKPVVRDVLDPFLSVGRLLSPIIVGFVWIGIRGLDRVGVGTGLVVIGVFIVAEGVARAMAKRSSVPPGVAIVSVIRTTLLVTWIGVACFEAHVLTTGLFKASTVAWTFGQTDIFLAGGVVAVIIAFVMDSLVRLVGRAAIEANQPVSS